jgi:hypothetical protein
MKISRYVGWRGWLRRTLKQIRCNHSHCATFQLEGARRMYGEPFGSRECHTPGLVLDMCYKCGMVWCRDYRA